MNKRVGSTVRSTRRNRFYDTRRFGLPQIRVFHRAGKGERSPRYLLKCGCCDNRLEVCYDCCGLEIGGVHGAVADWREILAPLLGSDAVPGRARTRRKAGAKKSKGQVRSR